MDFNTSYVSVQVSSFGKDKETIKTFQYILCVGSSKQSFKAVANKKEFQYILCVGSSFIHWEYVALVY